MQILHKLSHPNTLKFYNWYSTRSHMWVILEYVTGGDLRTLLAQDKRLPESVIKVSNLGEWSRSRPLGQVFGVDIMSGLQYIHSVGILYCDLKPSNLLVNEYGVLKVSASPPCWPHSSRSPALRLWAGSQDPSKACRHHRAPGRDGHS